MKLLAFGDLHLGAGVSLGRAPGDRLADQDLVLRHIFEIARARETEVDAVLIAGDVFEGPIVTPEQMDVFATFVDACAQLGIPVLAISGNGTHDAAMRTVNGLAIFDRLPGITVYSRPALHDLGPVQVACLPWVSPARLIAHYSGDVPRNQINARAAELLVRAAAEIADPRVKPTVLMMHGSLSGASLPQGIATDQLREPVIDTGALLELGYAAVVAGHIHQPQAAIGGAWWPVAELDGGALNATVPLAFYTGSPMPLNFGETHVAHGCWLLDVDERGTRAEFVPIESRPLVVVDYVPDVDPPDVDGAIVKVKVTLTEEERRRTDLAALRATFLDLGAHTVKIDVDTVREQRSRVDGVTDELSPLEAFDAWVATLDVDPGFAAAAREQMVADLETVNA